LLEAVLFIHPHIHNEITSGGNNIVRLVRGFDGCDGHLAWPQKFRILWKAESPEPVDVFHCDVYRVLAFMPCRVTCFTMSFAIDHHQASFRNRKLELRGLTYDGAFNFRKQWKYHFDASAS